MFLKQLNWNWIDMIVTLRVCLFRLFRNRRLMKIYCSTKSRKVLHRVSRSFLELDCVERVVQRRCAFFCFRFQVWGFGVVTQSFTKFYTEMHGVFLEMDYVERAAQSRFNFFVSGLKLFLILFRNFGIKKERLPVKKRVMTLWHHSII